MKINPDCYIPITNTVRIVCVPDGSCALHGLLFTTKRESMLDISDTTVPGLFSVMTAQFGVEGDIPLTLMPTLFPDMPVYQFDDFWQEFSSRPLSSLENCKSSPYYYEPRLIIHGLGSKKHVYICYDTSGPRIHRTLNELLDRVC